VPGETRVRGTGIGRPEHRGGGADAAQLLAGSAAWTPQDQSEFKAWLEAYFNWLLTSKPGRDEARPATTTAAFTTCKPWNWRWCWAKTTCQEDC